MQDNPIDPNANRVSEDPPIYGEKARVPANHPPLAPDGLPWPTGYFDKKLRVTLEEAIKSSGVRPSMYRNGVPVYTDEDCKNPNYEFPYPPEPEWIAEILAEADRREKCADK